MALLGAAKEYVPNRDCIDIFMIDFHHGWYSGLGHADGIVIESSRGRSGSTFDVCILTGSGKIIRIDRDRFVQSVSRHSSGWKN